MKKHFILLALFACNHTDEAESLIVDRICYVFPGSVVPDDCFVVVLDEPDAGMATNPDAGMATIQAP